MLDIATSPKSLSVFHNKSFEERYGRPGDVEAVSVVVVVVPPQQMCIFRAGTASGTSTRALVLIVSGDETIVVLSEMLGFRSGGPRFESRRSMQG
ncbi:hypothetical protein RRG08_056206 [Elysia crispata]|uniref:Uncharacterized protein n=1 Tax=Elysia crispata TaxID=231223 RepID=A0AAE1D111_9GAST|nr:hypothetical protein RRG08_056206 [Elysia crispata]